MDDVKKDKDGKIIQNYGKGRQHKYCEETAKEVEVLCAFGNTIADIASYFNIHSDTLSKYYEKELRQARIKANAKVASGLFHKATRENDVSAQIFWLKTRARWRTADSQDEENATSKMMLQEIMRLRSELDAKNKKDY